MLINYLKVFGLTFLPFLELRYSIPWGILNYGLNPLTVFLVAVLGNFLIAVIIYKLLDYIHEFLLSTKIINRVYERKINKLHKKVHPKVEKYGIFGLALFIAIPLPGSGVYSGALAAYILGMDYKDYLIASLIGVIIAGIIVTLLSTAAIWIF